MLAGSAAYAVSEVFQWTASLERKPWAGRGVLHHDRRRDLTGLLLNFVHLNPIKALFLSAVLNGVVAGPVMAFMMLLARNPKVMGKFTLSPSLHIAGWVATAVMILVSIGMFATASMRIQIKCNFEIAYATVGEAVEESSPAKLKAVAIADYPTAKFA